MRKQNIFSFLSIIIGILMISVAVSKMDFFAIPQNDLGSNEPQESAISDLTVELLVCVDKEMMAMHNNNTLDITQYVCEVIHDVWEIYNRTFGIDVILTNITYLYEDPYTPTMIGNEVDVSSLLSLFHQYCTTPDTVPAHDYRILLSGKDFQDSIVGYGGISVMCTPSASGAIVQSNNSRNVDVIRVAHYMGHGFGMNHDSNGNVCPQSGYIMNAVENIYALPTQFSNCSIDYLTNYYSSSGGMTCLANLPTLAESNFSMPYNQDILDLYSWSPLSWNISNIFRADIELNGEKISTSIDVIGKDNFTVNIGQLGFKAGLNLLNVKFYDLSALGSGIPVESKIIININIPSSPSLIFPLGGDNPTNIIPIGWEEGGLVGQNATYSLYYRVNGSAWGLIHENLTISPYLWNITDLVPGSGYEIKIIGTPGNNGLWISNNDNSKFFLSKSNGTLTETIISYINNTSCTNTTCNTTTCTNATDCGNTLSGYPIFIFGQASIFFVVGIIFYQRKKAKNHLL